VRSMAVEVEWCRSIRLHRVEFVDIAGRVVVAVVVVVVVLEQETVPSSVQGTEVVAAVAIAAAGAVAFEQPVVAVEVAVAVPAVAGVAAVVAAARGAIACTATRRQETDSAEGSRWCCCPWESRLPARDRRRSRSIVVPVSRWQQDRFRASRQAQEQVATGRLRAVRESEPRSKCAVRVVPRSATDSRVG